MASIVKRRIFISGSSEVIALPTKWLKNLDQKEVDVVFDKDILLVIPDSKLTQKIAERITKKVLDLAVA